jgi:hypothetical protein
MNSMTSKKDSNLKKSEDPGYRLPPAAGNGLASG